MVARYERIADELRDEILAGVHPVGSQLPSEAELAERHGAARGTVRQAVAVLVAEGLVGSRQGARRIVLGNARSQSFAELHSFAQWARAGGHRFGGQVIEQRRRPATAAESARLGDRATIPSARSSAWRIRRRSRCFSRPVTALSYRVLRLGASVRITTTGTPQRRPSFTPAHNSPLLTP